MKLVLIDYDAGNIRSALRGLQRVAGELDLSLEILVSGRAEDVARADMIVLPGDGAFGNCANHLFSNPAMEEALEMAVIKKARPFLGICVGMQLLADVGYEGNKSTGLGWISGEVRQLRPSNKSFKVPHMGWNQLHPSEMALTHSLTRGLFDRGPLPFVYFLHSFQLKLKDQHNLLCTAEHGEPVTAMVAKDNVAGTQFHPEKSQQAGLAILSSFLRWRP